MRIPGDQTPILNEAGDRTGVMVGPERIVIPCKHCAEQGCITCRHEGYVEVLTPAHQFLAGYRTVTFDPVDQHGNVHCWIANKLGDRSKGLVFPEAELRELIRAGAAHFDAVDGRA